MTPQEIIDIVCDKFEISHEQFFSRTRKREVIFARQAASRLIHEQRLSLKMIGEIVAGEANAPYDHTTVRNSIRRSNNDYECIESYQDTINKIRAIAGYPPINRVTLPEYYKNLKSGKTKPFTSLIAKRIYA